MIDYSLSSQDLTRCIKSCFSCIPYAERHWQQANQRSVSSWGAFYHRSIAVIEYIPVIGAVCGLADYMINFFIRYFSEQKPSKGSPSAHGQNLAKKISSSEGELKSKGSVTVTAQSNFSATEEERPTISHVEKKIAVASEDDKRSGSANDQNSVGKATPLQGVTISKEGVKAIPQSNSSSSPASSAQLTEEGRPMTEEERQSTLNHLTKCRTEDKENVIVVTSEVVLDD